MWNKELAQDKSFHLSRRYGIKVQLFISSYSLTIWLLKGKAYEVTNQR